MKSASYYIKNLLHKCRQAVCLLILLWSAETTGQCMLPLLSSFDEPTTTGVTIEGLDFNTNPVSWDIEFGPKGFVPTQQPTVSSAVQAYALRDLEPGSSYEVYLRTECQAGVYSGWNGPYFFNTIIDNSTACGLDFEISDNRCPIADEFGIEISGYDNFIMGRDVVLEKIELLITHTWPPDLSIELESPHGRSIALSQHNGNPRDDYGDLSQSDCAGAMSFSDNACSSIETIEPPFLGILKPEVALSEIYSDDSPDGIWKLKICDRASGDLGSLNYVNLVSGKMNLAVKI